MEVLKQMVRGQELFLTQATGTALRIERLYRDFDGNSVLKGVNLSAEPGEFVAILGRSGCGKSTLLRLVAGLDTPDAGEILVDGIRFKGANPLARLMFQDSRLLPWKRVIDNVALGALDRTHGAHSALVQVGLADRAGEWPATLSGGQRQRVALARALHSGASLLLLDEPFGALDALTRIEMQRLVEELWLMRGFTTLLVTHDVSEAIALADRIVVLERGEIALDVPVYLPRPRHRGSEQFGRLEERVLSRVLSSDPTDSQRHPIRTETERELSEVQLHSA